MSQQPFGQPPPPFGSPPSFGQPPKKSNSKALWIVLGVVGAVLFSGCLFCGGVITIMLKAPSVSPQALDPYTFDDVAAAKATPRGQGRAIEPGIVLHEISFGPQGGYYSQPGAGGVLWLYLPEGEHEGGSLPCVMIAPAGTNMISGMALGEGDQPEHLPYVRAGFAVVAYELDGPVGDLEMASNSELMRGYEAFKNAKAGLINARNALEYVLSNVPEVDPNRIYSAGHSSAAGMSLLFAEHEPRLAGCVAYAPCYDLSNWYSGLEIRAMETQMPGLADFLAKSSPITHESHLLCPVFLFHAEDDGNLDIAESRKAAARLKAQGADVTLKTVASGNHYESMIDQGIPQAIEWLKQQD